MSDTNNSAATTTNTGNKKYILVIEDDKFYGNIFKTKLAKVNYEVELAGDGEQGLKSAQERKPDLILLDIMLPIKDGFDTLKELKASAKLKDVPVIVLSNLGQNDDIEKAKSLGAADYMIKANVSLQDVTDKINKYLP